MSFDFPTLLVIATFITGAIWAFDALVTAPRRKAANDAVGEGKEAIKEPLLVEYSRSFFPVILIVLLLRSFVAEPFRIPSGSMMPTLLVGDFILVNKFSYGLRLPVNHQKIVDLGEPQRGDVVVFRYPRNPSIDYIKRVIGVPGDRIAYYNKQLTINGKPMAQESLGLYIGEGAGGEMSGASWRRENLDGVEHEILAIPNAPDLQGETVVPPGHYFVMGDNRDRSNDSRVWGMVPEENLVGKAFLIWMNWDWSRGGVKFQRIGNTIQ